MKATDLIIGLFFSDENGIVYDNIKLSKNIAENLTDQNYEKLKSLSLRFLGPLFLTAKIDKRKDWKFELLEASLFQYQERTIDVDLLQSFFSINSSLEFNDDMTNLFSIIGSPYTEDVKTIHDLLTTYIHPNIIQGLMVNNLINNENFKFLPYIKNELTRGVNVINYFLGSARKMYWEQQQKYYCVGFVERKTFIGDKVSNSQSNLYTFDFDDDQKNLALTFIPSYYVMAILPNYYENLISETLHLLNPNVSVYPVIRLIRLSNETNRVIYLEEHSTENKIKKSYGVILISENSIFKETHNLSYFKKQLRLILDKNKNIEKKIIEINSMLNPFNKWNTLTENDLEKIKNKLDTVW